MNNFISVALMIILSIVISGSHLIVSQLDSCEEQQVTCVRTASYGGFSASGVAFGFCKPCEEGSCASAYASACDTAYDMAFQTALSIWAAAQVPKNTKLKIPSGW